MAETFKQTLTELYTGTSITARRFRYGLIGFDFISIFAFIAMAPLPQTFEIEVITFVFGLLILADFSARMWISNDRVALMRRVYVIADIVVIATLLISPIIEPDTAFVRILRGLRLVHSYHLLNDLRLASGFFRKHERTVISLLNLFVFVFFTTSVVFAYFFDQATGVAGYVDALYFTITTLTTTGYGDITPLTIPGKLFSVLIMIVGVALFVQLARAIFIPSKVHYECKHCGLSEHDADAVHCKHCGNLVKIKTPGFQ
ncbi:potassium channel family protein [Tateyamaria pelophila]|uniref:potassium channel family protein n=1 Tax=Tateyamaria pelophila TaxID=328415 RepID=UPI001CBE1818|nr:potassium channel family protein [Tateyamaria pelophila]